MTRPLRTITELEEIQLMSELDCSKGTRRSKDRGFRNVAMFFTMLETGLRVSELCSLKVGDLWFSNEPVSNLVVRYDIAKNHVERIIPLSDMLMSLVSKMYLILWSPVKAGMDDYAFFSRRPSARISPRTVERVILRAGLSSLGKQITPHMLRHTFATRLLKKTNIRVVQMLLGHTSLQSTQIYTHPDIDDLRIAINAVRTPPRP